MRLLDGKAWAKFIKGRQIREFFKPFITSVILQIPAYPVKYINP